jgi:deoxyribodipyrimidine photo-lyase
MKNRKVIVWFRQDLRLHDNEALTEAMEVSNNILPVYVFDERLFKNTTRFGFKKTGIYRAKFIIESIHDLRNSLKEKGTDLIVRIGKPEEEIYKLAKEFKSSWIFCNRERTQEEADVQDELESKLWSIGQEIRYSRGKMLYYTQDLPFPISHTPDIFSHFRKEVEKFVFIRDPLPLPEGIKKYSLDLDLDLGDIPSLEDLGYEEFQGDARAAIHFKGGETEGLKRLNNYIWETQNIRNYKETRNGLLGESYSSKFSPWLSQGCLSPKKIFSEIKKYEAEHGANDSTYWLFFELMWRDFFRLMGKKHGNAIFKKGGIKRESQQHLNNEMSLFNLWKEGRTGIPFIDANMKEINQTGFMSNRGRQNVASFLVKDLKVNWQIGAEYFESMLIDYDSCSNWGNWNYTAGVGSDPREDRYFNIISQARRHDPNGEYVKHWIPELNNMPKDKIHTPDILSKKEQEELKFILGSDYPKAMVNTNRWTK